MAENRAIKRFLKTLESMKVQVNLFSISTPISDIKTCMALLADDWREFQALEKAVKGKFDESQIDNVDKIENMHLELKQKLVKWEKLYEENNAQIQNNLMDDFMLNQSNFLQQISSIHKPDNEVRLPRVNIPSFNGVYAEFPSFRDLYEASVHNNNNISKVHKLQYLKGLLKGEAYMLINHLAVTEANYDEAWDKIKTRYNKPKHVIHNLLKQFLEQPNVQQGCARSIRHLADVSDEVLRGLKVLDERAEGRDPWLIYLLIQKLDQETREAWAHETAGVSFPTMEQLFIFLNKRSDALESLSSMQKTKTYPQRRTSALVSHTNQLVCPLCEGEHYLSKCDQYLQRTFAERKQLVVEKKLCFNCLSSSHQSVVCRSKYKCGKCRRKHHLTLHSEEDVNNPRINATLNANALNNTLEPSSSTDVQANAAAIPKFQSLLPTAIVLVADKSGNSQRCRLLLDSGSQASFITEACAQRLNLPRSQANVAVTGLTAGKVTTRGITSINIKSLYSSEESIQVDVLIINQLPTRLPSFNFQLQDCCFLDDLKLADPSYNQVSAVDILIGADRFFSIIKDGQLTNSNNSIVAQRTIFGWIAAGVTGEENVVRTDSSQESYCTLNFHLDVDIDRTLKQFFEQEEIPNVQIMSQDDVECEEYYKKTHKRDERGRYIVSIPFKNNTAQLGNSINVAKRRFLALERKFQSNPSLKHEYARFISEYLSTGYLEAVSEADKMIEQSKCFYLPHHCVIKQASETTKLRVVFDGSAKSSSGISLNETMLVGPTIQPTLWSILLRFRKHKIALAADIEKMYNQILVCESDSQFQRILWRSEIADELKHYKLNTVTFGLSSSAFLAIRSIHQLAYDNQDSHPNIIDHLINDFYVDDFISGADNIEEATKLKREMNDLLISGGFNLRKWKSNVPELTVNGETQQTTLFNNSEESKILGLQWNAAEDTFTFKLDLKESNEPTKRQVISEYSRVFDPLGWLSPSIILMKIVFQRLWLHKLGWDDHLPAEISEIYNKIRVELKDLEKIKLKRYIPQDGKMELHGFSDASESAYSAVVYCRAVDNNGVVSVNLMAAKTKVAPIKQVSLPRLELCGAHLLTKLMRLVQETVKMPVECFAWTDSTIVLSWLSSHPVRWKTYVANRTAEIINQIPRKFWNHVRSEHNPADCASRGILPSQLIKLDLWWHGPAWLKNYQSTSAKEDDFAVNPEYLKEERKITKLLVSNTHCKEDQISTLIQRISSYNKLKRIFAYVLRFINNMRNDKLNRSSGSLTVIELRKANLIIIKYVQREAFADEVDCLQREVNIRKNSSIVALAPFIDAEGMLRVGGRLKHLDCQYDYKHPMVLPKGHALSRMIAIHVHKKNLHPGLTLTFHLIRQQFWIVGGRSSVRNIVNKCVVCFRKNAKTSKQLMGDLPLARLKATRPFSSCGVDYAGPNEIATKKGRGAKFIKGYIALFVCMVTRAVHIEAVTDLSTDAFIASLKRFISRRGAPAHIYSDNGSNFIGARRKLGENFEKISNINHNSLIAEFLAQDQIQWHFIPPVSPHFGGLWEAAVKSVKSHLLKYSSNTHLTFEEMTTMLTQIEAILNSRPLYATADDDASIDVLTPAHFLIGSGNFYIPEENISENTPTSRLSRWQNVQQRVQSFWKKFSVEYFHNLQQRNKWRELQPNFKNGDVVLIKEDNLPSYKWMLGKIIELHPDDQGNVRVVTVKTSKNILKRPIVKICKLPQQDDG